MPLRLARVPPREVSFRVQMRRGQPHAWEVRHPPAEGPEAAAVEAEGEASEARGWNEEARSWRPSAEADQRAGIAALAAHNYAPKRFPAPVLRQGALPRMWRRGVDAEGSSMCVASPRFRVVGCSAPSDVAGASVVSSSLVSVPCPARVAVVRVGPQGGEGATSTKCGRLVTLEVTARMMRSLCNSRAVLLGWPFPISALFLFRRRLAALATWPSAPSFPPRCASGVTQRRLGTALTLGSAS